MLRTAVAVFLGGLVGTALRIGIDAALPHADGAFPLSTLIVNVLGSFVLGALVARVWPTAPASLRAALGAGILGSFTTFSAVMVSLVSLGDAGLLGVAAAYLALTLVLGFGAAIAGLALGARSKPIERDE